MRAGGRAAVARQARRPLTPRCCAGPRRTTRRSAAAPSAARGRARARPARAGRPARARPAAAPAAGAPARPARAPAPGRPARRARSERARARGHALTLMFGRPAPGRDPVGPRPLRAARPAAGRIAQQSASTPGSSSRHPGQRPPAQRTAPRGGGMLAWPPRPLTSSSSCSSPCARARRQRQPHPRPLPAPPLSPVAAQQQGASGLGPGGPGRAAATRRSRGARLLSRADQRQRHAVRQEGPHAVLAPGATARGDPRLLPTVDPLPPMHPACMHPRSWVHGSMFNQPPAWRA